MGMDKISPDKVAAPAGAIVIGLILALYQVQGWKMPIPLAVLLLVLLFLLLAIFMGTILLAGIKAIGQIMERRTTSATWISNESPGLLDCQADADRAIQRLLRELERFRKEIDSLNGRASHHERDMKDLLVPGNQTSAKTKQRRANQIGKELRRSAIYLEKRVKLFNDLTGEIVRICEVMAGVRNGNDQSENLMMALELFSSTGESVKNALSSYKSFAESYAKANLTKIIREESKRLVGSLDALLQCFAEFQANCLHLDAQLRTKRSDVDSSIPGKEGSPP